MDRQYIIGQIPQRKQLIIRFVVISLIYILMYFIFIHMLAATQFFILYPESLIGFKIVLIVGYVITVFAVITAISLRQYFIINDEEIQYYSNEGFLCKIKNTLLVLKNYKKEPVINIKLNQIDEITLLYNNITSICYFKGHSLVYHILLKDGTFVVINPDSFHFTDQNMAGGIDYLIRLGISINDPYHLLKGLKDPHIRFADYVERIVIKDESHI